MSSPISLTKQFQLPLLLPVQQFYDLGKPYGNPGETHTVFLSKSPSDNQFTLDELVTLNGYCKYAFLLCSDVLCGFVVFSPSKNTRVKGHTLAIGHESEKYDSIFTLFPQNVIIFQSETSSTLFTTSTPNASQLLVKVET
jgi:hypothetical protein